MPIYTYRCENCGVQFERQQSFSDQPLTRCPECNKNKLRKVITPAGIVFKGSGWYATDHRSKSSPSTPSAAKTSESKETAPVASATSTETSTSSSTAKSSSDT